MALCGQCGSIQVTRAAPNVADRFLRVFFSTRPFVCRRCGWRGRREWTDEQLLNLQEYGVGGAEPDPSLVSLDQHPKPKRRQGRKQSRKRAPSGFPKAPPVSAADFDLAAIDLARDDIASPSPTPESLSDVVELRSSGWSGVQRRLKRSRRREIIATVVVTALAMFLFLMIGLTGSCASVIPEL